MQRDLLISGSFVGAMAVAVLAATSGRGPEATAQGTPGRASEAAAGTATTPTAFPLAPGGGEEAVPPKKYPKADPSLGILEGRITLSGEVPELPKLDVPSNNQDYATCVKHVRSERLILGKDKGVRFSVISVGGYKYKAKRRPAPRETKIDNKNCLFHPHVQATTVGSKLVLSNSDPFIHNTRGLLKPLSRINIAIPSGGKVEKKLRYPGWGVMKCDYHPWMMAHIHVFPHDLFDVSGPRGKYKIVNIPPGEHQIVIWHEFLAPQTKKVTIVAGETTKLDIALLPRKK